MSWSKKRATKVSVSDVKYMLRVIEGVLDELCKWSGSVLGVSNDGDREVGFIQSHDWKNSWIGLTEKNWANR